MTHTQTLSSLGENLLEEPKDLPEIAEWIHLECEYRANRQYDLMVPFMGFNLATRTFDGVEDEELRSLAYKAAIEQVKCLYQNDIVSPDGVRVGVTDDVVAWIEEYWLERSYFVTNEARDKAQSQVARHFADGKRFTMGRFFAMQADQLLKAKQLKETGLM